MRVAKQTALVLLIVFSVSLAREAWYEVGEGVRGLIAGIIVGLVIGSVATLSWLSFTPDPEDEPEPGKRPGTKR